MSLPFIGRRNNFFYEDEGKTGIKIYLTSKKIDVKIYLTTILNTNEFRTLPGFIQLTSNLAPQQIRNS